MHTSHAKCIVNDQRDFVLVCDLCLTSTQVRAQEYITVYLGYLTNWTDIVLWVSNAFHEYGLGILVDSRGKG